MEIKKIDIKSLPESITISKLREFHASFLSATQDKESARSNGVWNGSTQPNPNTSFIHNSKPTPCTKLYELPECAFKFNYIRSKNKKDDWAEWTKFIEGGGE